MMDLMTGRGERGVGLGEMEEMGRLERAHGRLNFLASKMALKRAMRVHMQEELARKLYDTMQDIDGQAREVSGEARDH